MVSHSVLFYFVFNKEVWQKFMTTTFLNASISITRQAQVIKYKFTIQ
jgi:hypothetical protein